MHVQAPLEKLSERMMVGALVKRRNASVAWLANELALPVSTVGNVLNRLLDRGRVSRQEIPRGTRGRPQYAYTLRLAKPLAAFQFDGTQLAGSIFTSDLEPLAVEVFQLSPLRGKTEAAAAVRDMLHRLAGKTRVRISDLDGAAVAINAVNVRGGTISSSVLTWVDQGIESLLSDQLQLKTRVVSSPLLLAEYQLLDCPVQPQSVAYLHVGDGVSGHFITGGAVHRGGAGLAGELGHVVADINGPPCGCGRRGCLEAICSGPAIFSLIHEQSAKSRAPAWLRRGHSVTSPRVIIEHLWQAWQDDEPGAKELIDPILNTLAWGAGLMMNLIDPEVVIAGGYVLENKPAWVRQIALRAKPWILHADARPIRFVAAQATTEDCLRIIASQYSHSATRSAGFNAEAI